MSGPPPPLPGTPAAHQSRWSIVARQFRKKQTSVWGFRVTVTLVLIAIYAPLLASGVPFVWRPHRGDLSFPFFATLFDRNVWEHAIDRFFNLLLVLVTLYYLVRLVIFFSMSAYALRARRRAVLERLRKGALVAGTLCAVLQLFGVAFVGSRALVDYRALHRQWQKREADRRLHRPDKERERLLAVFAVIPYGHGTQLPTLDDRFRESFDFERGEVHLFGTDEIGRDVFTRILYGTRISLTIGIVAVSIYVAIGTVLGALAGYFGGRTDMLVMRLVEVMICIPGLFLILTIVALFQSRSIFLIMVAIGIVSWTGVTRLVRGEFLRERNIEYVSAARAMGFSAPRIVFKHILPNATSPVLVAATFGVAAAILTESTLAFLGLGDVTVPSWGRILDDGRIHGYWHLIVPPSVAIFVTVTALNLVGDGLRDALDPKLRD